MIVRLIAIVRNTEGAHFVLDMSHVHIRGFDFGFRLLNLFIQADIALEFVVRFSSFIVRFGGKQVFARTRSKFDKAFCALQSRLRQIEFCFGLKYGYAVFRLLNTSKISLCQFITCSGFVHFAVQLSDLRT